MTEGPKVDDLEAIQRGAEARKLLEHTERCVGVRNAKIRKRIYKALDSGTPLDPVAAVQAWLELHEGEKLVAFMEGEIRRGVQAGERAKPDLERNPPENAE